MPNAPRRTQDLPSGYPSSHESAVALADGRPVEIRPILPSDAPELAEAVRTADAKTLRAVSWAGRHNSPTPCWTS
jgi:hypothetical protein